MTTFYRLLTAAIAAMLFVAVGCDSPSSSSKSSDEGVNVDVGKRDGALDVDVDAGGVSVDVGEEGVDVDVKNE